MRVKAIERSGHILNQVGNTPLIRLEQLSQEEAPNVELYAKAEWFNPGGSVKDRPALNIIQQALIQSQLNSEKTILDATSGNTGIALAMIGSALRFSVKLCLPKNASPERKQILHAYGAELILTDPLKGSDGAIEKAQEIFNEDPSAYYYVDQYNNENNWKAHYQTTGPEIWNQTKKRITHFVSGLGTTGTIVGVGRFLKEMNPKTQIIAMQPDSPFHGLEGLKHLETAIVPGIWDASVPDEQIQVSTEEAYEWTKRLAQKEGIFVGISSGANLAAALRVAKKLKKGVMVTVFCDSGDKYLSEKFWDAG